MALHGASRTLTFHIQSDDVELSELQHKLVSRVARLVDFINLKDAENCIREIGTISEILSEIKKLVREG